MPETLCPACGHSPIPAGAEECPSCGEPFAFLQTHKKAKNKFVDHTDSGEGSITTFGGAITSSVTAHPYPPAVAFAAGAVAWFLRASGLLFDLGDPVWVYGLVVADLAIPLVLILNLGPAKLVSQLVALAGLGVAAFLGREDIANPVHLLFGLQALACLVLVTGDPGVFRRSLGVSMACALAAAGVAVLGLLGARAPTTALEDARFGYRLALPSGFVALTPEEIRPAFHPMLGHHSVAFGSASTHAYGELIVDRDPERPLVSGCSTLQSELGGTNDPRPLAHPAPRSFGSSALVYELITGTGGIGRLACAKLPDGRFVGLAVVLMGGDAVAAETTFDAMGAGLTFR